MANKYTYKCQHCGYFCPTANCDSCGGIIVIKDGGIVCGSCGIRIDWMKCRSCQEIVWRRP